MSDPKQVVQRKDAAFEAKDAEARPWSADVELVAPGVRFRGREQIADFDRRFWEAFPDARLRIQRQIASGSLVATEGILTANHTGVLRTPQGEVPPTGRRVEFPYMVMNEVRGDEVVSEHLYFDQLAFLGQLGQAPGSP